MAQENEELNRRRQRRERMKAHYQKQQRDLIIRLIAVAAVLLVSAVAIVVLSLPKEPASPAVTTTPAVTEGTSGSESTDPIPSTTAPGTVPTEETAPSDTTVIRFAAAGDLNITDQVVAAGGGAVKVVITGERRITEIKIAPEIVDEDDIETMQDIIVAAVNEAIGRVESEAAAEMSALAAKYGIPEGAL